MNNDLQNTMQNTFSPRPVIISILTTCVMLTCTGNFLIRARDSDVQINYFCRMMKFRSRAAIFLIYHIFRCKVSSGKYYSLKHLSNV